MATPKQTAANKRNAQKSTGPVSAAGKRIASTNAYKHGLTGQIIFRTAEEQANYLAYAGRLMPDLAPRSAIEVTFAERIIADSWRLDHTNIIERTLFDIADGQIVSDTGNAVKDEIIERTSAFVVKEKTFNLISLYRARIQRGLHKDLEMLRKIQKQRREAEIEAAKQAVAAQRQAVKVVEIPTASPEIGSVSSTPPVNPTSPPQTPASTPENMAA